MCGRYALMASKAELEKRYDAEITSERVEKEEEIFPTTSNLVLLPNKKIYSVKWGFAPSFAKQPIINARSETILEKPTFREPFEKKRCIIPATAFFEWEKSENEKDKTRRDIRVKGAHIFSIAGICERYPDEEGESILRYAILTTEANEQMAPIHHRMPVLLHREDEEMYLNLKIAPKKIKELLRPYSGELEIK